jgi:phenylacetate-CoA ligase
LTEASTNLVTAEPALDGALRHWNDDLALLDGDALLDWQLKRVGEALENSAKHSSYWRDGLVEAGVDAGTARSWSRDQFVERVPAISKRQLVDLQQREPPYGGMLGCDMREVSRIYVSYGPLHYPLTSVDQEFFAEGFAKVFHWAGAGPGDVVDQTLQYNWVAGGTIVDEAFRRLGCAVIPGGAGQREMHMEVLRDLGVTVLFAFPTFVRQLLETAAELGVDPARDLHIDRIFFTGETIERSAKKEFEDAFGAKAFEFYGTTETGIMAAECEAGEGMHLFGHHLIELIEPVTGSQLPWEEGGEIVATSVRPRRAMPLFRYRTGDITEGIRTGPCACGRRSPKLGRIVGRAGSVARVKGMFLFPDRVADALSRVGAGPRFQVVITRPGASDVLTVRCEGSADDANLHDRLVNSIRERTGLSADVELLPPGTLGENDAVLKDMRANGG